jgi:hypothetical protein
LNDNEGVNLKIVAGEIKCSAIQYALENNYKYLELFYHYYGIYK